MLKTLLTSPLAQPIVQYIELAIIGMAFLALRKFFATHAKVSALSTVADAFQNSLNAFVKADPSLSKGSAAALAWKAAETQLEASWPDIENALGVELSVVLGQHAAIAAGQEVTAPGGTTVQMPTPVKIGLMLLACLLPFQARAQTTTVTITTPPSIDWKTIIFSHNPSTPLLEIDPKNPHPAQVAAGAGYGIGACIGQTTLNKAPVSLICLQAIGFAEVTAPNGAAEGGVQAAFVAGFLSNAIAVGPLLTPYTADGNGFLQGGRPGTKWVAAINPVAIWHLLGGG